MTATGGEKTKKLLTTGTVFALVLAIFVSGAGIVPALAKVTETLPGGNIQYFSGGRIAITVPPSITHFPVTSQLEFHFVDFADSTYGSYDQMGVYFMMPNFGLAPLAIITTSQSGADFNKLAWKNTFVYTPPLMDNVKVVSSDVLQVERHGNSITVDFNPSTPIPLKMYVPPTFQTSFTLNLPAFHIELDKYSGSVHSVSYTDLTSFSGYTLETDIMGFSSNSAFTCAAWNMNRAAGTDSSIVMHGILTWTPPS